MIEKWLKIRIFATFRSSRKKMSFRKKTIFSVFSTTNSQQGGFIVPTSFWVQKKHDSRKIPDRPTSVNLKGYFFSLGDWDPKGTYPYEGLMVYVSMGGVG